MSVSQDHWSSGLYDASWKRQDFILWMQNSGNDWFKHIWAVSWENQHLAYAKTKTQISFAVTAKLISAFVLAARIVQCVYFLNPKFQASSYLQWLYSLVRVRLCQNPHCGFSHIAAHFIVMTCKCSSRVVLPQALPALGTGLPKNSHSHHFKSTWLFQPSFDFLNFISNF